MLPRPALLCGLGLIVTVVYGGELSGYFLGDDLSFLFYVAEWTREGELVRQLLGEFTSTTLNATGFLYRPLYVASFASDYLLWGTNPFGWHLTNLGLHLANAVLLGCIVERIAGRSRHSTAIVTGSAAALFFALRPSAPEVVVWVSGRTDSLALFGMLVALLAYLQARGQWGRWYLLALGGFLFALGSKEAAVTLPGALAALHLAGVPPLRSQSTEPLGRVWGRQVVPREAFLAGRPVLSTNRGALPEAIRPGEDGLLVPAEDPAAMAAALRRLVTEPGLIARLQAGALIARQRVKSMADYAAEIEACLYGKPFKGRSLTPSEGVMRERFHHASRSDSND